MPDPLPPLTLDDIRVCEPDRDSAAVFDPSETWIAACIAIENGHAPEAAAALLLELGDNDLQTLRDWWRDECREIDGQRDAECCDLLLCRAIDETHKLGRKWPLPPIDSASVLHLLAERDRLRAALTGFVDQYDSDPRTWPDDMAMLLANARAALGEG